MTRTAEFSKQTRRNALKRSGNRCEASGSRYGLDPGKRCNMPLSHGIIFDHDNPEANSKDASLENCRAICPFCNCHKTGKTDIPMIAKTVRQQDKAHSIKAPSKPFPGSRSSEFKRKMDGTIVRR